MSRLSILVITSFIFFTTSAGADFLRIEAGRVVSYAYQEVDPKATTLVFLPGLNRSVPTEYLALNKLKKLNYNILTFAISSHWESLSGLNDQEKPFFERSASLLTPQIFQNEMQKLITELRIKKPVLVGLSFSSVMLTQTNYPKIYAAPLVRPSESNPSGYAQAKSWESVLALNPILGPSMIRQFRDSGYRQYWQKVTDTNLQVDAKAYAGLEQNQVINSYISISQSAEKFDLTESLKQDVEPHLFILAGRESRVRLKGQLQAIEKALEKSHKVRILIIKNAEHNVFQSTPSASVTALTYFLDNEFKSKNKSEDQNLLYLGLVGNGQKIEWQNEQQTESLFEQIRQFPDSTEPADLKF